MSEYMPDVCPCLCIGCMHIDDTELRKAIDVRQAAEYMGAHALALITRTPDQGQLTEVRDALTDRFVTLEGYKLEGAWNIGGSQERAVGHYAISFLTRELPPGIRSLASPLVSEETGVIAPQLVLSPQQDAYSIGDCNSLVVTALAPNTLAKGRMGGEYVSGAVVKRVLERLPVHLLDGPDDAIDQPPPHGALNFRGVSSVIIGAFKSDVDPFKEAKRERGIAANSFRSVSPTGKISGQGVRVAAYAHNAQLFDLAYYRYRSPDASRETESPLSAAVTVAWSNLG